LLAARFHRRYQVAWWDALIIHSAIELGCGLLWTEHLQEGRCYGTVTVRNPFR
jgi:predicted nucleic acid-binding protein